MRMTAFFEASADTPAEIPTLDEVVARFDDADSVLQMAYSRYLDRPSARKMNTINDSTSDLFDSFGEVLRKLTQDQSDTQEEQESSHIIASLLHNMNTNHSRLLAEYSDVIVMPTERESSHAFEHLKMLLEDESGDVSDLIDEALGNFREILDTDMEVIEHEAYIKAHSKARLFGEQALKTGMEVAKISGAVIVGMAMYDKLKSR